MHFAVVREKRFTWADILGPPPSAAELAARAAVDIALIDARMTKLTYPDGGYQVYDRGAQPYPDRPPGPIETLCHPGARVVAVHY